MDEVAREPDRGGDARTAATTVAPATSPAAGPPARRRGTWADMVRSMLLVVGIVLAIVALTPRPSGDSVREVDVAPSVERARTTAAYAVLAPEGLPAGWRPTSARVEEVAADTTDWRIGYVTPAEEYAAFVQSDRPRDELLEEQSSAGAPVGTAEVGGDTWQRLERDARDQRTLWRAADGSTVLVTGTASWAELAELAGGLRVQSPAATP